MPRINPKDLIQQARQKSDTKDRPAEGHPRLPTWMRESPKECLIPYNPIHTYLKRGQDQDGHRVSPQDFDRCVEDD